MKYLCSVWLHLCIALGCCCSIRELSLGTVFPTACVHKHTAAGHFLLGSCILTILIFLDMIVLSLDQKYSNVQTSDNQSNMAQFEISVSQIIKSMLPVLFPPRCFLVHNIALRLSGVSRPVEWKQFLNVVRPHVSKLLANVSINTVWIISRKS